MVSWDLIRGFLALHRMGSYEGAAQLLGVDHSTLRRKIQSLEASLGATLFTRRDNQFVLSVGHETLLEAALQMEAASTLFFQESKAVGRGGVVRISTLDIFANLLAPDLAKFRQDNPGLVLHVTTEPHLVDLDREAVDIAIRLARPTKGSNCLKKLSALRFGVFGSPEYLAYAAKQPEPAHRLVTFCAHFIHADHDLELVDSRWNEKNELGEVVASADAYSTLLRLCEEGMGLAMLPDFLTIGSSRLVRVAYSEDEMLLGIWMVIRKDIAQSPKIRQVVLFLTNAFDRYRHILKGKVCDDVSLALSSVDIAK